MNKLEFKKLSHDIRICARKIATTRGVNTRAELHNLFCWCDDLRKDKFGSWHYNYSCIGDYDIGLVWEKSF